MSSENSISYRICRGCLRDTEDGIIKIQSLNVSTEMHSLLIFLGFEELEIETNFICDDCTLILQKVLTFKNQCESSRVFLQKQNDVKSNFSESDDELSNHETDFECIDVKSESIEVNETKDQRASAEDIFNTETDIKLEKDVTYSNVVYFTCSLCDRTFQKEHYLIRHKYFSHGETNNLFPCMVTYCHTICNSETELKNHHQDRHVTTCNICNKKYKTNLYLRRHKATNHFSPKFYCSECPKVFKQKDILDRHIDKSHSTEETKAKQKICETCGKECTNLKRHMQAIHLNIKNFKCDYCDAKFLDKCRKVSHEKIMHFNYKRYKCEYCAKSFAYKPQLVNHIRVHTGEKPFVCSICSRAFAQARTLQLHQKIIHKIVIEKKRSSVVDDNQT